MKKFSKIIFIFVAITILMTCTSISTFAGQKENFGRLLENKEIVGVYCSGGKIYYLNEQELKQIKSSEYAKNNVDSLITVNTDNDSLTERNVGTWTSTRKISEGSPYLDYSQTRTVTPSVKGPATISSGSSASFSYSASVSLTASDRVSIGGTWSASSNSSFGISFNVPSGRIGYVVFTPKYKSITAERITYFDATIVNRTTINIKQPVKAESFADRLYELRTS